MHSVLDIATGSTTQLTAETVHSVLDIETETARNILLAETETGSTLQMAAETVYSGVDLWRLFEATILPTTRITVTVHCVSVIV